MINYPVVHNFQDYKFTQNAFLPHIVTVPLNQENSTTCNSLVKPGDIVSEGQVIAKSKGIKSEESYVHSPIPGKVLDIVACVSPNGKEDYAIKIQLEGKFSYLGKKIQNSDWQNLLGISLSSKILEKGVVNTFKINEPTNFGVQIKNKKDAKTLVVRLFDEDPTRLTDSLISKFYFDNVLEGAKITAKAMNVNQIVFAINKTLKKQMHFSLEEEQNITLLEMNFEKYPCGTQKDICNHFNRKIKKYTISKKDVFTDSSTMYEVYKAISLEIPSLSRPVHISGNCLKVSCLLDVKIGTSLKDIVNQLGGFFKEPALILINGSLSGISITNFDVPITKYVKSISFQKRQSLLNEHIYSCVRCGNCRYVCPVKLSPDLIYNNAINFREFSDSLKHSTCECIDCACCNAVCPSRLPLCQTIYAIKEKVINSKENKNEFEE